MAAMSCTVRLGLLPKDFIRCKAALPLPFWSNQYDHLKRGQLRKPNGDAWASSKRTRLNGVVTLAKPLPGKPLEASPH